MTRAKRIGVAVGLPLVFAGLVAGLVWLDATRAVGHESAQCTERDPRPGVVEVGDLDVRFGPAFYPDHLTEFGVRATGAGRIVWPADWTWAAGSPPAPGRGGYGVGFCRYDGRVYAHLAEVEAGGRVFPPFVAR